MRFFRGFAAGEKGFAGALALPRTTAWLVLSACIIGSLTHNNVWAFGGLSKSAAHSLDKAILVIGLPPVFFFIGIFYYIYRRRGAWRGEKDARTASDLDSSSS
jgi:hypothetical protein